MSEISFQTGISTFAEKMLERAQLDNKNAAAQINPSAEGGRSFADTLKDALHEVNASIKSSDKAIQNFSSGKAENLHDVLIAVEKAEISLRTLQAVRGKMIEAYQEIMRTPV